MNDKRNVRALTFSLLEEKNIQNDCVAQREAQLKEPKQLTRFSPPQSNIFKTSFLLLRTALGASPGKLIKASSNNDTK